MTPSINEQNPWPGLGAFDESAERFFNGRDEQTAALRRLVSQAPLTVLFGASGLGKTSLLQAGLFPLSRKDLLPVYIRLDWTDKAAPLINQVKARLESELLNRKVDAPAFNKNESLWEYLHRSGLELWSAQNQLLTPLFVFDQFEEVFTLGAAERAAIAQFKTDLADLIENRMPANLAASIAQNDEHLSLDQQRYKVLLSFREDFLPQLEGWKRDIPSIMRNRLRLLPMSGEHAFEAVHKTAPHLVSESVARRIVAFVAAAGEDQPEGEEAELEVAPALLSLVCAGLNERRKQQNQSQIDEQLLKGTGNQIVADFYRKAVSDVPARVRRFIESELITERGFRKPCDVDDAHTVHKVSDANLALLVNRRLLRIEPARGTMRVELTHDLLTRVVREERDRQRRRKLLTKIGAIATLSVLALGEVSFLSIRSAKTALERAQHEQSEAATRAALARDLAVKSAEAGAAQAVTEFTKRGARSHELAGAAIVKLNDGDTQGAMRLALDAIETTREVDKTVLPDAQAALRRTTFARNEELDRPGHKGDVTRIEFSPDTKRVATSGLDDGLRIWDVATSNQLKSFQNCASHQFSRDWKKLACTPSSQMRAIEFWDVDSSKLLLRIGPTRAGLDGAGISPDGRLMLWESLGWTHISTATSTESKFEGTDAVLSLDGKVLATKTTGAVKVWNIESGKELSTRIGQVDLMDLSPDGALLTTADASTVSVLEVSTGKGVKLADVSSTPSCLALNPDGSRLLFVTGTTGHLVDTATGKSVGKLDPQADKALVFNACAFSRDGNAVSLEHVDATPAQNVLVDLKSGQIAKIAKSDRNLVAINDFHSRLSTVLPAPDQAALAVAAFSPDKRTVVSSGANGIADMWDPLSGRSLSTLAGKPPTGRPVYVLAYSSDGNTILVAGEQGRAALYDARTSRLIHDLGGHKLRILAAAFTPDSKRVVTSGYDHKLIIWDVPTGKPLIQPTPARSQENIFAVAFTPDGKRLALGGNELSIRNATSSSLDELLKIPGNMSIWEEGLLFSPDAQFIAAVSPNGVQLLRMSQSKWQRLAGSIGGKSQPPIQIAFSRDSKRLVTPGTDHTIKIWDTATGNELTTLHYESQTEDKKEIKLMAVTFSANEREVYAIGDNWSIFRSPISLDDLIAEAKKRLQPQK